MSLESVVIDQSPEILDDILVTYLSAQVTTISV